MGAAGKILVIEDNDDIRDIIKDLLELKGFSVIAANSGPRGIRLAIKENPELILCDIMMPNMDGFEVFLSLREITQLWVVPFLFVTAKSDSSTFREAMNLGADDFIVKPFSASDLLEAVSTRLHKSQFALKSLEGRLERVAIKRVNDKELESIKVSSELLLKYGREMNQEDLEALHRSIYSSTQRISRNRENFELYEVLLDREGADLALSIYFNDEPAELIDTFDRVRAEHIFGDQRGNKVIIDLEPAVPDIPSSLLFKILLEVFDNARKHGEKSSTINVKGMVLEDQYLLTIENKGEELPFDFDSTMKPVVALDAEQKVSGVGLGLYIIRMLCKRFDISFSMERKDDIRNVAQLVLPLS